MSEWVSVCALAVLDDPGAHGFSHGDGAWPLHGFVVRTGGELHAWVNRCPHAGHRLDWAPHRFLTRDRRLVMCASHGAVFEPHTGLCVGGPCPGARLTRLPVRVNTAGNVEVEMGKAQAQER